MQFVGMVKPSTVKRGFLRRLLREVEEHGEKKLEYAGFDRILGDPDYHLLRQLTTLDIGQMLKRYLSKLHLHGSDDHVGARPCNPPQRVPCISASSPHHPSLLLSLMNSSQPLKEHEALLCKVRSNHAPVIESFLCLLCVFAEAKLRALALRMNRNALLAEKRSRLLLAIRQTYNDFFHDYFITSNQVFVLRASSSKGLPYPDLSMLCGIAPSFIIHQSHHSSKSWAFQ